MYVICKRRMPRVPLLRCHSQVNPICKCGCVLYCMEGNTIKYNLHIKGCCQKLCIYLLWLYVLFLICWRRIVHIELVAISNENSAANEIVLQVPTLTTPRACITIQFEALKLNGRLSNYHYFRTPYQSM